VSLIAHTTKKPLKRVIVRGIFDAFALSMMISSANVNSQDLLSNNDLQDSPLSLSLMTTVTTTLSGESQELVVGQYGILNKATISQMVGMSNSISISQLGENNMANISQMGSQNVINLEQEGSNNFAEIIQEGNANIANIIQQGEQTFIVHQIGNDMVINITQY
jgi:minor curlin subunit